MPTNPQAQLDVLSAEEMATLDEQAKEAKEELEAKKKELRTLQSGTYPTYDARPD